MSTVILSDGSVLPSYYSTRDPSESQSQGIYDNYSLRVGVVYDVVWPDNSRSLSKKYAEYVVDVSQANGYSPTVTTRYFGVPTVNLFGGLADFERYTLRVPDNQQGGNQDNQLQGVLTNGSKVLILCPNGRTSQALIIGGARDATQDPDSKDDGHKYEFVFNGVDLVIDDDGEWTLTKNGPTNNKGELRDGEDSDKQGGTLQLDKDGNFNVMVPTNIQLKSDKGTLIGQATDKMLLGSTYRDAEHAMNETVATNITAISNQINALGGLLQAAGQGLIVTAPPSATALGAAAALCNTISQNLSNVVTAINQFEGNADSYLSENNKND